MLTYAATVSLTPDTNKTTELNEVLKVNDQFSKTSGWVYVPQREPLVIDFTSLAKNLENIGVLTSTHNLTT